MRKKAPVVWHCSLPLMNSFNKTVAVSPMQAMLAVDFAYVYKLL